MKVCDGIRSRISRVCRYWRHSVVVLSPIWLATNSMANETPRQNVWSSINLDGNYVGDTTQPTTGSDVAQNIDWESITPGAAIPTAMPTGRSDDPVRAGFSPEWVRRAVAPLHFSPSELVLAISTQSRMPDDRWAYAVEDQMREVIRKKLGGIAQPISRVFCNSVGCLAYVESTRSELPHKAISVIFENLMAASEFGIRQSDLKATTSSTTRDGNAVYWVLVCFERPPGH